jgi:hypothetical protein
VANNAFNRSTTSNDFIPELWSTKTSDALEFACNLQKRVNRSFESVMRVGDTLHIPTTSNLSAQAKSESTDVTWEDPTETKTDITVATYEYVGFLMDNLLEAQANVDLRSKYTAKLGYALSRSREVALGALFASFTQSVGTDNVELTADEYRAARLYLAKAGLLENGGTSDDISIFVTPTVDADNLAIEEFISADYNKNADAIGSAKTGKIYGMPVYVSNLLDSTGIDGFHSGMFHRDVIALIVQKEVPVVSQFIIEAIADGVLAWHIYGCGLVNKQTETPRNTGAGTAGNQLGVKMLGK